MRGMYRMLQMTARWSALVFGPVSEQITPRVRAMRLLEEALELAQAEQVTAEEADIIRRQVYGKEPGQALSELGGVMVTLAAYCATRNYDPEDAFWREFERIMDPAMMEKVRRRNLEGDKIGLRPAHPQKDAPDGK